MTAGAAPAAGGRLPCTGVRPADPAIHVGRDGWLFRVGGDEPPIDFYGRLPAFDDALARRWVALLGARADRLQGRGVDYVHLGIPDRLTLMHRHLDPDADELAFERPDGSPILRLVARHEREASALLNVVPYLARQIDRYPVFWKSDTQWSPWGCYLAYQMLCSRLHVPTDERLLTYPFDERAVVGDLGARVSPPPEETIRVYRFERHARRRYANPAVRYAEAHGAVGDASLEGAAHVVFENASPRAAERRLVLFDDAFPGRTDHLLAHMLAETVRELHLVRGADIDDEYVRLVRPDAVVTAQSEDSMRRVPRDELDVVARATERVAAHRAAQHLVAHPRVTASGTSGPGTGADTDGRVVATPAPSAARRPPPVRRERLLDPETVPLAPPSTVQPGCVATRSLASLTSAPVELVEVRDARVHFSGTRALVTAPGGEEILRYGVDAAHAARLRDEDHRRVRGTTLLLGDSAGAHLYYHWMLDVLPKLGLLERAGIALDSIDRFAVRELGAGFQRETLARLGIGAARVVETVRDQHLHCERLLCLRFEHGAGLKMHRAVPAWVRRTFGEGATGADAAEDGTVGGTERLKLYISRPEGVRRGIVNEAALRPWLEAEGFTVRTMEGLSVARQARLLARADVVVAAHGGALTNTLFCRPGTTVVEIFSRHVFPYYYALAALCGHRYHAILEAPAEDYARLVDPEAMQRHAAPEIQWRTQNAPFEAPIDAVRRTLARL